jgi:aspartate kinase
VVFKLFPVPFGPGFLTDLFAGLSDRGVVVDIITQSQNEEGQRLAFSVTSEDLPLAQKVLSQFVPKETAVQVMEDMAKISVVGVGMRNHPGVAARFFAVMKDLDVPIHLVTTSEIKISAVIDRKHLEKIAQALHHTFDLDN